MGKQIFCSVGVHVDAVAGWLGSYGGEDSPCDISRGVFAAEHGVPRLLNLFKKMNIPATWFTPGHSAESFPKMADLLSEAAAVDNHEIGLHGYSHENPLSMTPEQEEDVFNKSREVISKIYGKSPTGYVAPWWEFSAITADLLIKNRIKYDNSLMHNDFQPYYYRKGDSWTKIDYGKKASEWMIPFKKGTEITSLVEIPGSWYIDDLPPMMFIKANANSHGFVNPRHLEQVWKDQFDWVYREYEYAVYPFTIHPDVSGRPQVLLMLERLITYMQSFPGVTFVTYNDVADDFIARNT